MSSPADMQYSDAPAKPSYPLCGHRQWQWPHKLCTLHSGHAEDHCNRAQAGIQNIELWWSREVPETK